MHWYLKAWKNAFTIEGRARRSEYWWFHLTHTLICIASVFAIALFGGFFAAANRHSGGIAGLGYVLVLILGYVVYALAAVVPSFSVAVRRLHDTNRSGWWLLVAFLPCVGGIILLVLTLIAGDRGPNQFGPDPKQP